MTPLGLRRKIAKLSQSQPITNRFEKQITTLGIKQPNFWYATQKEHWLGWLSEYGGPGYYGRQSSDRTAEYCYNHINCSPMLLWLVEASGVRGSSVAKAKKAALSVDGTMGSQCKAIRTIVPWCEVESSLRKSVKG